MMKLKVLQEIVDSGSVAAVRAEGSEQAARIAEACAEGGVAAIEIAFTVRAQRTSIRDLAQRFTTDEILLGAGTVLESHSETRNSTAMDRYPVPYIVGASTLKEVTEGMECGGDMVKVSPAETQGPAFVKAVRGPLPKTSLMPTGGDNLEKRWRMDPAGLCGGGCGRKSND